MVTVLIRPMYKTDLKYRKGMYVAVYINKNLFKVNLV